MYEYFTGIIANITPGYLVVEVQGIGYQVAVANPYAFSTKKGQEHKIYIHQVVREDAHLLFGFQSFEEKQLFLLLLKVSGIGPKSALAILASAEPTAFVQAIEAENSTYLTKFPGVGKKTAQQMVLDLKGKLGMLDQGPLFEAQVVVPETGREQSDNPALEEAYEALLALGYSEREWKKIKKELEQSAETTTEGYVRFALKCLMRK